MADRLSPTGSALGLNLQVLAYLTASTVYFNFTPRL